MEVANFGIVCLTPENVADQWINFEAGALSKSFGGAKVWTYLYDLDYSQVTGPLAQFQHTKADRSDTLKLVLSINEAAEKKMEPSRLETLFDALWPKLEEKLKNIPKLAKASPAKRSVQDITEENLEVTRGLAKLFETLRSEMIMRLESLNFRSSLSRRERAHDEPESDQFSNRERLFYGQALAEIAEYESAIQDLKRAQLAASSPVERRLLEKRLVQEHMRLEHARAKAQQFLSPSQSESASNVSKSVETA